MGFVSVFVGWYSDYSFVGRQETNNVRAHCRGV